MKKKILKFLSVFLAINILTEIIFPTAVYALSGGPSQPEVQSFEPVGTTEMVNLSSGDFVYNIPLLDIEGYPVNISYHSGITMDQEASWVGLGWNINPGVINRNMRGLPDDFKDDVIQKDQYIKPNTTFGASFGVNLELFGFPNKAKKLPKKFIQAELSASIGVFYNNYRGVGFEQTVSPSISAGQTLKLSTTISSNTQNGMDISPSFGISLSGALKKSDTKTLNGSFSFNVGASFNSRTGVKARTFSKGLSFSTQTNPPDPKKNPNSATKASGKEKPNENKSAADDASKATDTKDGTSEIRNLGSTSNGGSSLSYGSETYTPQINMPMTGLNLSFNGKMGTTAFGIDGSYMVGGYFTSQYISDADRSIKKGGYGYLYAQDATSDKLMDLNREKDGAYSQSNPNLPVTNFTHDLYAVSGQGIGGMFRPHRGDVGHVHDDESGSNAYGGGGGGEIGTGNLLDWGVDVKFNHSSSKSGQWSGSEGNGLINKFRFKSKTTDEPFYEAAYFKSAGEKTKIENDFIAYANIKEPIRPALETFNSFPTKVLTGNLDATVLMRADGNEIFGAKQVTINNNLQRKRRDARNQAISYLTAGEGEACVEQQIKTYHINQSPLVGSNFNLIPRLDNQNRKAHHITEISARNLGGATYVYGIAAYNNNQEEITFTNKTDPNACSTGIATYENSYIDKKKGEEDDGYDGYYNATKMNGYAHSYLLTSVLSADYLDKTGNGVTDDDYGTYTKFNYSRTSSNYKWRTPYSEDKAIYAEGLKSDTHDDKGSIVYGEKELWYLNSIETKNYIAEFKILYREDGLGVTDLHGGAADPNIGSNRMYRLSQIILYSKADKLANGSNAVPIKTVFFEYDYSLCPNVLNNTSEEIMGGGNDAKGKLTLKRIYFTYGNSKKGKMNAYEFIYATGQRNPDYNVKGYDRWGNFKPNLNCSYQNTELNITMPGNAEFPYVNQNKQLADIYSSSWTLDKIILPSGGEIDIEYESDDYNYVQNKTAMKMAMVKGFSHDGVYNSSNQLYNGTTANNWVHIHIPEGCADEEQFIKYYVPDTRDASDKTRYLYFTFLTRVKQLKPESEYVRGYAEIEPDANTGIPLVRKVSNYEYAIKVKSVTSENTYNSSYSPEASPFAKAAWQYFRLNLPQYVYPGSNMKKNAAPGMAAIKSLFSVFFDIFDYIQGINDRMLKNDFAKYVDIGKCWVRVKNGTGFKYGGGVRVKKISLSDVADEMGGGYTKATYGQEYDYTTVENGRVISSGVASYEPMTGNDENPFRLPIVSKKENALIPDETFYVEEPMGESFFPGAGVVYSKVTVRNLSHTGVKKHATGKVVNEFYTTKDFPTLVSRTSSQASVIKPDYIGALLSLRTFSQVSVTQGYQIELNDMDGKPKAEWVYAENLEEEVPNMPAKEGKLISGKQYFYKTDPNNPNRLNNNVKVIDKNGLVDESANVLVGVEADMILDTRSEESKTASYGLDFNSNLMLAGIFPITIPIIFPTYNGDQSRFRSAVITRVIQRYGILEKTVAYVDNATIATENIAYDAETGDVLLTKTQNEYNDNIYNLTYPAHWAYEGMEQAYKNEGAEFMTNISASGSGFNIFDINVFLNLHYGDHLLIESGSNKYYATWVGTNEGLIRINDNLPFLTQAISNCRVKVIRSGRDNNANPAINNFTMLHNPIVTNIFGNKSVSELNQALKILNASGTEYADSWWDFCETNIGQYPYLSEFNATQLIDVLNYMFKGGFLNQSTTLSSSTITSNSNFLTEYQKYLSSFIHEAGAGGGFDAYYSSSSEFRKWHVKFTDTDLPFYLEVMQPIGTNYPIACTAGMPIGMVYVSDNVSFVDNVLLGSINVNLIYSGCTVPANIILHNIDFSGEVDRRQNLRFLKNGNMCRNEFEGQQRMVLGGTGLWRVKRTFLFLGNRLPADNLATDIRKDGYYSSLNALFEQNYSNNETTGKFKELRLNNNWTWTSEITKYSPITGRPIETKDPLMRYDAMVEDYNHKPFIMANNAERREVGFDGIEYYNQSNAALCPDRHWNFRNGSTFTIDNTMSHTGKNSIKLVSGQNEAKNTYFIRGCGSGETFLNGSTLSGYLKDAVPCNFCILPFSPFPGREYVISGWVKVAEVGGNVNDRSALVNITFDGVKETLTNPILVTPTGVIIEGWQKFEKKFFIPIHAASVSVSLKRANGKDTWYDDIRVFPYHGNMKSYVYDQFTNRLMAELDENNYATFYEYDEQGALKRVKKETENGIMTLQESRNHIAK